VAKLVDAADLGSASCPDCGFESRRPHSILLSAPIRRVDDLGRLSKPSDGVMSAGPDAQIPTGAEPRAPGEKGDPTLRARPPPGTDAVRCSCHNLARKHGKSAPASLQAPGA
jgi:hypothetical protein